MYHEPEIPKIAFSLCSGHAVDAHERRANQRLQILHRLHRAESLHARQEQEPVKLRLFPCEADVLPPHAKERNFLPQARVGILVIYADRGGIDSLPNAVH